MLNERDKAELGGMAFETQNSEAKKTILRRKASQTNARQPRRNVKTATVGSRRSSVSSKRTESFLTSRRIRPTSTATRTAPRARRSHAAMDRRVDDKPDPRKREWSFSEIKAER